MKSKKEDLERRLSLMEKKEKRSYLAYLDFKNGMLVNDLVKKHNTHARTLYPWFKKFMADEAVKLSSALSGHKNIPYYDNEDDYAADRVYTWSELSNVEKLFYQAYESKNKGQHTELYVVQ